MIINECFGGLSRLFDHTEMLWQGGSISPKQALKTCREHLGMPAAIASFEVVQAATSVLSRRSLRFCLPLRLGMLPRAGCKVPASAPIIVSADLVWTT